MVVDLDSPPLECVLDLVPLPKKNIWKGKNSNYTVEIYGRHQLNQTIKVDITNDKSY